MTLDKLLEMLELDEASQFEYFENFADLTETDEELEPEVLYQLFKDVDMDTLADIIGNYFDELLESVPEDAMEVYTLIDSVKMSLMGMAKNISEDTDTVRFADQYADFHRWFSIESQVYVCEIGNYDNEKCVTMRDALILSRVENLGGEKYEYTFDEAMDLEIDEYAMSFADLAREEQPVYDEQYDDLEDVDIPGLEYTDHIFRPEDMN